MKKLIIGLLLLSSTLVFADELAGLKCDTDYIILENSRTPYATNRVVVRKSLLGGKSVLGYMPIHNLERSFKEEFNLAEANDAITFSLDVQLETSILSIKIKIKENEESLLDKYEFKTKVGFSGRVPFFDLIQLGTQKVTNLAITCLPAYR